MIAKQTILTLAALVAASGATAAQTVEEQTERPKPAPGESDYYVMQSVELPEGVLIEAGGMLVWDDGEMLVCTRRGQVFWIEWDPDNPSAEAKTTLFTEGLQEPLGLLEHDGWIYCTQRGEVSRMRDVDGDHRMDEIETVCDAWPISGNYHEYNFGPRLGKDGHLWVTTNKPFGGEPFGKADYRGWALRITLDGEMIPTACGLRSPAGVQNSPDGEIFYTDNQGEWCGASKLSHIEPGDFHGHPHGIYSANRDDSPIPHPGDPPNGELMPNVSKTIPTFKLPAVWFPYDKMGKSPAGFAWDQSAGKFGPFAGQVFAGDQHHASVMRVSLEKVRGHWQGACYPFRYGFDSGLTRVRFAPDGTLYAGLTNRGWGSRGDSSHGIQRLVWTGEVPFEVHEMVARADGFELRFTQPIDVGSAGDAGSYTMSSYTYKLHAPYGSPEVETQQLTIESATALGDGRSVHLKVAGLREGYVHELKLPGVRSTDGHSLLHPEAYYTLVHLPATTSPE